LALTLAFHHQEMTATSPITKTPTKAAADDQSFELPDTPTSLASSYNKDVIYNPASHTNTSSCLERNINDEITQIVSKKMQYNALHDSIETSSSHPHNNSILQDFQDIKAMIAAQQHAHSDGPMEQPPPSSSTHAQRQAEESEKDAVQKWLQIRKRWQVIQQTYERKMAELHDTLQAKSAEFEQRLTEMAGKENKYKKEIKNLHHQIETIQRAQSKDGEQRKRNEQEYRKLHESNVELHAKYQAAQQEMSEKGEMLKLLEAENKKLLQINGGLSERVEAMERDYASEFPSKLNQLTEQLNEANHENARLKQLEATSQNMVERLLKRLEQQIHSAEATQQQLNLKQKQHDEEILKLEQINSKLQKNLVVLNNQHGNNEQRKVSALSPCSSDSSIFTLSTVMTKDNRDHRNYGAARDEAGNAKKLQQLQLDLEAAKEENESLKQIVKSFEQMLNMSPNGKVNSQSPVDWQQEWTKRTKHIAKQTVLVEKLKNEIVCKDAKIRELERFVAEHKEKVNALELTAKQQRNSISLLEKTNSDISMELIEERSLRQRLEKDIEDLQFENKQLRNKLIAFKNFASQTQIGPVHYQHAAAVGDEADRDQENKSPNQKHNTFLADDVFERAEQVSMGRPSDANTIHLRNSNGHKDELLLNGLKHLIDRYASQQHHEQKPPAHSAPNTVQTQRNNEKLSKRVVQSTRPKKAEKLHTPTKKTMVEKVESQGLWKGSSANRKAPKNRHRISCMTPVSYLKDQENEQTARNVSMRRKVKSSNHEPKRKKRAESEQHANRIKVIRISKPKRSSSSFLVESKVSGNNHKRRKCAQSASKRAMLHPCVRHKHWV